MFNGCGACRRRLARRSEGTLPRSQWARLEAHLAHCAGCRRLDEADRALHMALSLSMMASMASRMSRDAAEAFDDRVLNLVLNQQRGFWQVWFEEIGDKFRKLKRDLPAGFLNQVAGGAFVAASVTAFSLFVASQAGIHPFHSGPAPAGREAGINIVQPEAIPLEQLMRSGSPRASQLWTRPANETAPVKSSMAPGGTYTPPIQEQSPRQ